MTSTLATILFSILPLTYPSFPDLAYMACTYALQFPFWSYQGTLSEYPVSGQTHGYPHTAWISRFIEAGSFIARACRFFFSLFAFWRFLKSGSSCLFRPCYVPRVRYTCDSIPAFDFLFFFPLYGVLFLCFRGPSILLPFSCAFFTRYSAAG